MKPIDLTTRTVTVGVFLAMWCILLGLAVWFAVRPEAAALDAKLWELFGATNLTVAATLNSTSKTGEAPPPNGGPANPTKQ
jgi:hypothetical protein